MKNKLIQFREWLSDSIISYKDGTLMSSHESLFGEHFYKECLKKFDETFNMTTEETKAVVETKSTDEQTIELSGIALDWAVAICAGITVATLPGSNSLFIGDGFDKFRPSTDWSQGGPIIAREKISFMHHDDGKVSAIVFRKQAHSSIGTTMLEAAMRCYCTYKLGDVVSIPEELCVMLEERIKHHATKEG